MSLTGRDYIFVDNGMDTMAIGPLPHEREAVHADLRKAVEIEKLAKERLLVDDILAHIDAPATQQPTLPTSTDLNAIAEAGPGAGSAWMYADEDAGSDPTITRMLKLNELPDVGRDVIEKQSHIQHKFYSRAFDYGGPSCHPAMKRSDPYTLYSYSF